MHKFLFAGKMVAASPTWAGDDALVEHGRGLVEINCAPCLAAGPRGASLHADAPPFRDLHLNFPIGALAEALAEGISTGHSYMPVFIAVPAQIDPIIAYIERLSRQ